MKKKLYFLALILCIFGALNTTKAQETVLIGDEVNAEINSSIPFDIWSSTNICQQVYTADEINHSAGVINSLAVKFWGECIGGGCTETSTPSDNSFERKVAVYINNTELANMPQNGQNVPSGQVANFDGTVAFADGEWTEFVFTNPFQYEGGNIMVTMYDYTGGTAGNEYYYFYVNTEGAYKTSFKNSYPDTPFDIQESNNALQNSYSRNIIKLTFTAGEGGGETPEPEQPTDPEPEEPGEFATGFYYDFNDGSVDDWTKIDADGDGYNFGVTSVGIFAGYDGSVGLYSSCYDGGELSPDNYFVTNKTYAITSTSFLSFLHHTSDALYTEENFGVVVSENGTDWIVVWSKKYDSNAPDDDNVWPEANVSLADYAGKNVYLGFRHYNCNGSSANGIRIDNVKLYVAEGGDTPDPSTPLSATITADNEQICENETIQFNVNATGGSGSYSYLWSPTDGLSDHTSASPIFTPLTTDWNQQEYYHTGKTYDYTCIVTDEDNNTATSTTSVMVYEFPELSPISIKADYVEGGQTVIVDFSSYNFSSHTIFSTDPSEKIDVNTYNYSDNILQSLGFIVGETNEEFKFIATSHYDNGCKNQTTVTVEVVGRPLSVAASADKETAYVGENIQLTAVAKGGSEEYTYSWSPANGLDNASSPTPTFTPSAAGTYTFTCTVSDGTVTASASVTVKVEEAAVPEAPEVWPEAILPYSIYVGWDAVDGATGYNIHYTDGTNIYDVTDLTGTYHILNNLEAGTEYFITMTASNEFGDSDASMELSVITLDADQQYRIMSVSTNQYLNILNHEGRQGQKGGVNLASYDESVSQIFTIEKANDGKVYFHAADGYYINVFEGWGVSAQYTTTANATALGLEFTDFYENPNDNEDIHNGSAKFHIAYNPYYKVERLTDGVYYPFADGASGDAEEWILEFVEAIELDPAIPTGLTATAITSKTIDLSWDAAENAKSYNVYQDGELVSKVQGTSFKVEGLEPSTDYCFTVTSVNITKESNHSEKVCVTTKAPIRPDAPADLEIAVNGIAITLTWSEVDNAESYNVYQGETKISSGITNPIFTIGGLNENTRYCYTVTAVADLESEHSDELCAKTQEMGGEEGETEEIAGTGSSFNNNLPIYSGATGKYSMSQQYYTKDEINNTGGNITSISYYVYANASLTHNLEIYLNNVDEFGFEMDNMYQSPCRQVSANDLVFVGDVTFPSGEGWVEIKLGKPFMYTGNHILVTVVDNTPSTIGKAFYTRLFEKENCTGYYNSGNSIDPTINSYQMMIMSIRNDIRFTFAASASTIEFITDGDWNTADNWNTGAVPSTTDDVIIKANATINGDIEVKHLSVEGGSLTIESGSLTVADIMVNNYAEDLIIKDGAQLFQGYDKVKGTFVMDINNPTAWSEWNKTGWQFIASPFTNADVDQFTSADVYDLYKFEGDSLTEEWRNHKAASAKFEEEFVSGRGYMASYESDTTATLSGTFNNATSISYPVTYQDIQEGKPHWPNFHLLGNPFTFDMDLSNLNMKNMATGVAVVNEVGGYDYMETGTINVGDGFFVKSTAADPSVSYGVATRGGNDDNTSDNISVRVSSSATRDNVVLNFAGSDKAGFPKLNAFNEDAAYLYVVSEEKRYGIFNYDKDINEVSLSFETQKMSRYTISIDAEGEYESIVLVDRRTGIETNMLLEDYSFTATTSTKENTDRFLVRFTFKSDVEAETETFAYQSGDELIINAEGTVQLFDVTGRILYVGDVASHGERINVGHLNNAAYILRLVNEEGVKVQKVIIY